MNGARALLSTLVDAGVEVCFANPGTSEMHFVAALDDVPAMRGVLCLFEGVVTGAADGYGRVAGRPAATLLHLGPGLGNGLANLHNARRARTPIVNMVGDHATYHARYDAPLQSDIASIAGAVSGWYRSSARADDVAADAADAVAAAMGPPGLRRHPGPAGRLLVVRVLDRAVPAPARGGGPPSCRRTRSKRWPRRCARASAPPCCSAEARCVPTGLRAASRVAATTGAALLGETFPANLERGRRHPRGGAAGLPGRDGAGPARRRAPPRPGGRRLPRLLLRLPRQGQRPRPGRLHGAHPGPSRARTPRSPSRRWPRRSVRPPTAGTPAPAAGPTGRPEPSTTETLAAAVGAVLPEGAIVVDEGNTSGLFVAGATAGAPRHDWLTLTGGAIGIGLPMATGAAVAAPERPVLCLQADGSAMYTLQALWTQAREGPQRDDGCPVQPELRDLEHGAAPGGCRRRRTAGPPSARPHRPRARLLRPGPGHGCAGTAGRECRGPGGGARAGFAEPGPALIEVLALALTARRRHQRGSQPVNAPTTCAMPSTTRSRIGAERLYSARNRPCHACVLEPIRALSEEIDPGTNRDRGGA